MGIRSRHVVTLHSSDPAVLRAQGDVYRQNRTPVVDDRGTVQPLDVRPADAATAGRHLAEVRSRFGAVGLDRSVRGLGATRGFDFAARAVDRAPVGVQGPARRSLHGANVHDGESENAVAGAGIGAAAAAQLDHSSASGPLPPPLRSRFGGAFGQDLTDIRVHDDDSAHRAADLLSARAFTVGSDIYFADGAFRPTTGAGARLLAHEVAHAVQQRGAIRPRTADLEVSEPADPAERGADRAADAALRGEQVAVGAAARPSVARIARAISFTPGVNLVTTQDPTAVEATPGATFQIAAGAPAAPYFRWDGEVTINGNAGDPFGNFRIGPHQVVRSFWLNIWWGSGANRTHRTSSVATPIRDATAPGNTWYHDPFASAAFAANGDTRSTTMNDTPGARAIPYANPVAPRVGSRGTFNWGMSFVSYISAEDSTRAGDAAFQAINRVYWNTSLAGRFDGTQAAAADRVTVTGGGRTNASGVQAGADPTLPTMHGGPDFNTEANANLTTT